MADQQNQELDPVSESWDRNIKLRNDLASRAGKPDNLEIKPLDAPKQLMGSAVSSVGTGIKELSLGDVARATRKVADGSFAKNVVDGAVSGITGKSSDELSKKGLLTDELGLDGVDSLRVSSEFWICQNGDFRIRLACVVQNRLHERL